VPFFSRPGGPRMVLVIVAGILNGVFLLPVRLTRGWKWENTWAVYSLVAMLLVPWTAALLTIPRLFAAYGGAATAVSIVLVCGIGWGIGSLLYGVAARMVGMALTYAIVLGLTSAVGALIPLLLLHPAEIRSSAGHAVLAGVAVSMVGIAICAKAGGAGSAKQGARAVAVHTYWLGMLACLGSGLLSPLINVGFAFGTPVMKNAIAHGARPAFSANAVWVVVLTAGCLVNIGYCLFMLKQNRSWGAFQAREQRGANWTYAVAAGLLWAGAYFFYGAGASRIGDMGAAIAWPIATSVAIVVGNLTAIASGEWKDRGRKASALLFTGVAMLVASVWIIAAGVPRS